MNMKKKDKLNTSHFALAHLDKIDLLVGINSYAAAGIIGKNAHRSTGTRFLFYLLCILSKCYLEPSEQKKTPS